MNKFKVIQVGLLVLAVTLWIGNTQASPNGPNNNYTGSPPDYNNCTLCHSTYPVNSGAGGITVSGVPASYTPGTTYPLLLTVADPQAMRWGFQVTALDPTWQTAGNLSVADPVNTQLNPFLPIDVIMHTNTGTYAGTPTSGSWTFDWTAPASGDEVTFYFAGNAANNNGFNTGDYIYTDTLMVSAEPSYPYFIVDVTYVSGSPVPVGGANLYYGIFIENASGAVQDWDGWVAVEYEGGSPQTLLVREIFNYQPGWQVNRPDVFYPVPGSWPGGNYELFLRVGDHPNVVWHEDSFTFEKLGAADNGFTFGDHLPTASFPDPFDEIIETVTDAAIPAETKLLGNYPNPFNPSTVLSFNLYGASFVNLAVYDVSGRRVAELVNGWRDAGHHDVTFDASNLTSGIYVYTLTAGDYQATGKMVLMK